MCVEEARANRSCTGLAWSHPLSAQMAETDTKAKPAALRKGALVKVNRPVPDVWLRMDQLESCG
jgi:hypothetical protein